MMDPVRMMENNLVNISAIPKMQHGNQQLMFNMTYNQYGEDTMLL